MTYTSRLTTCSLPPTYYSGAHRLSPSVHLVHISRGLISRGLGFPWTCTYYLLLTTYYLLLTTQACTSYTFPADVPLIARHLQRATRYIYRLPLTTCYTPIPADHLLLATCCMPLTAYDRCSPPPAVRVSRTRAPYAYYYVSLATYR